MLMPGCVAFRTISCMKGAKAKKALTTTEH